MLAFALEERGGVKFAAKRKRDDSAAENGHPAAVFARAFALFEMRFVEVEGIAAELTVPAILKLISVILGQKTKGARLVKLDAGLNIGIVVNTQIAGDCGVDAGFDRLFGLRDRLIAPVIHPRPSGKGKREFKLPKARNWNKPQEGEDRQKRDSTVKPAVKRLLLGFVAHIGLL